MDSIKKHEDFSTEETIRLVREDRIFPAVTNCYLEIGNKQYPIVDYASLGIAISASDLLEQHASLSDIPFVFANVEACRLSLKRVRAEKKGDAEYVVAFEITGDPIDFEQLEAIRAARAVIERQHTYISAAADMPSDIKAQVYEIKDWLENLKEAIDEIEKSIPDSSLQSSLRYQDTVSLVISKYLGAQMPKQYDEFASALNRLSEERRKAAIAFLREKLSHIIYQSPFAKRVFQKPLGYAGDYEMMNFIYRQESVGRSLFERCVQRFYIEEPAAQAVRNRADFLIEVITPYLVKPSARTRIISVACGPAVEWQRILKTHSLSSGQLTVDLLDQDEQALKYAQRALRQAANSRERTPDFRFIHKAIKNVIVRGLDNDEYDLIYSAGLFDYLSDAVARAAAKSLFQALRPGGKLVIGNFDSRNPTTGVMEYALDWQLIYRSESDLLELFRGIGEAPEIRREELGINLFCVLKKPE